LLSDPVFLFSPSIPNESGSSGIGLIQFIGSTAKDLGTSTKELSKMSAEQQLKYVDKYFSKKFDKKVGKTPTLEDVYMAILHPPAIGKKSEMVLFKKGSVEYKQNKGLDINRSGDITKYEASSRVWDWYYKGQKYRK